MEKLIAALGLSSKNIIGISVSANNIIEIAAVDKKLRTVTKYARRELKYNNAIREIISYDDFSDAIQELFKEINVSPKGSHVVLNMPNVHFAFSTLPTMVPDEQIPTALASEVDDLYLFKRHEPVVSWNVINVNKETEKKYIAYSAIQDNTIQNIKNIFSDLEIDLISVENVYSSILKGIIFGNVMENELGTSETSNIFLLNPNSFSILCMQGKKIVDYYEEPLAIKSFSDDEVYAAIAKSAEGALENYPSQNLFVVSETDDISAEMLCHKLKYNGNLRFIDRNMYTQEAFMTVSNSVLPKYIPFISLEAVGTAVYSYDTFPLKFNFLSNADSEVSSVMSLSIMGTEYEIERKAIYTIGMVVAGVILFLGFLLAFFINLYEKKIYRDISTLEDQYTDATAKINAEKITGDGNDVFLVTKQLADSNKNEINIFKGIASEIPSNIYLTSYFMASDGRLKIEGNSTSSDAIYVYIKGLKSIYSDISISKLQFGYSEGSTEASVYSFTIESEVFRKKAAEAAAAAAQENSGEQPQNPDENNGENPSAPAVEELPAPASP